MKLTIETNEYDILKVPFSNETKIVIHDYEAEDNVEYQEMYNLLESLGRQNHDSGDLNKWYRDNVGKILD